MHALHTRAHACTLTRPSGGLAQIKSYLLEKSRVGGPSANERNYHIFYQLVAGVSDAQRVGLKPSAVHSDYRYLQGEAAAPGIDDPKEWAENVQTPGENKPAVLGLAWGQGRLQGSKPCATAAKGLFQRLEGLAAMAFSV